MKRLRRVFIGVTVSVVLIAGLLGSLDRLYPMAPIPAVSTVVVAEDGTPLRAFPGANYQWRYPITLEQVSPTYLELLLAYEDRWFYQHPGVNPLALLRAGWQNLRSERVLSGGSTLTMQVSRLLYPHARSYSGKLSQILRALQLEWHYSKAEILNIYLNVAPFGGTLSGVQAASYYYFDKPASQMSDAEAALLAVLPQRPSDYRPDRHPQRARQARDKVLQRMQSLGLWSSQRTNDARQEPVSTFAQGMPNVAPLLARRLYQDCADCRTINTTLNYDLQIQLERLVDQYTESLSEEHSVAVMVMRNRDGAVRSYIGSADFWSQKRAGQVDIIQAVRSPGSTLKPFLYGVALDEGLIHSHSLLIDAPRFKSHYRPQNFSGFFNGPVTATDALQRSLNVPAVQLIEHFGADRFVTRLQNGGLKTFGPGSAKPNTSVILGGIGVQLESLLGIYSALARDGKAISPRFQADSPKQERYLMSSGAAWIIQDMLAQHPYRRIGQQTRQGWDLAWKTGTSYGYREAWAMGVSPDWSIGVWVGRPDGSASPGRYGRVTAAPLLFRVHAALPRSVSERPQPESVSRQAICWPAGTQSTRRENTASNCLKRYDAWVLNDTVPATLPETTELNLHKQVNQVWLDPTTGKRAEPACLPDRVLQPVLITLWPNAVEPWLPAHWQNRHRLPPRDTRCQQSVGATNAPLHITSWPEDALLQLPGAHRTEALDVILKAEGGSGYRDWYLNGGYIGRSQNGLPYQLTQAGHYQISVVDQQGNIDRVAVRVLP